VRGIGAGSDKAAGLVQHFIEEELHHQETYEVVDLAAVLSSPTDSHAQRELSVAEEMAEKGRRAYETLELGLAIDFLNRALSEYERHAADVTEPGKVANLLMLLGATHILRGDHPTGTKRLAQAVTIDPTVEPDPSIFNPAMRQSFRETTRRVAGRSPGILGITSNPSYARVYVDGQFVGVTPMALEGIAEGRHLVRLVKNGYRPWGRFVDVVGQVESADVATLQSTDMFEEYDALVEATMPSLPRLSRGDDVELVHRQLGDLVRANELLMAEVRLDGERVQILAALLELRAKKVTRAGTRVFSYDSRPDTYRRQIEELLRTHFAVDDSGSGFDMGPLPVADGLVSAVTGECCGMRCSEFETILLAAGGIGGGLLMITGGVLYALAARDKDEYENRTRTEELRSSGQAKATAGDILMGVGLATAVTAVSLYLFCDPSDSVEAVVGSSSWGWSVAPLPQGAAFSARIEF
jgi:hypothetical protein